MTGWSAEADTAALENTVVPEADRTAVRSSIVIIIEKLFIQTSKKG